MSSGFNYDANLERCSQCNLQFIGKHICPGVSYGPEVANFVFKQYIVQPGDNMELIANKFKVQINDLFSVNKNIPHANQIFPGTPLNIPLMRR
jgi:hypothetical protein